MKHNYQLDTDEVIKSLDGRRPSLLLQCCCGPCASYVIEYLNEHFDLTVLFYNPCIQPREEYDKRLYWWREVVSRFNGAVKILECDYEGEKFVELSRGLEKEREGGARCTECFRQRIGETAIKAAEHGFEFYCTTLSVSPHKDQYRINNIGAEYAEKYGVRWLPSDFKKREGYKRSIELSHEYNLYRQEYCGCAFSLVQSFEDRERKNSLKQGETNE